MDEQATPGEGTPAHQAPTSSRSSAENLIGLGALVLVANYFIFDLILGEYYMSTALLLAAFYALFAFWHHGSRPSAKWPLPYGWTMRLLGYSAGLLAAFELLDDLRYGVLDNGADILGGLILYAGGVLMFLGARQLKSA